MKYFGMPMGMWMLFAGSFRKKLTEIFGYDTKTAKQITAKAKPKYKQIIAELPHKFEAGTVNAAGAAGLHAALDYVNSIGFEEMHRQELALTRRAMDGIREMPFVHVLGS